MSWRWAFWPLSAAFAASLPMLAYFGNIYAMIGVATTQMQYLVVMQTIAVAVVILATWPAYMLLEDTRRGVRTLEQAVVVMAPVAFVQILCVFDPVSAFLHRTLFANGPLGGVFPHLSYVDIYAADVPFGVRDLLSALDTVTNQFVLFVGITTFVGAMLTRLLFVGVKRSEAKSPRVRASASGVVSLDVATRLRDRFDYLSVAFLGLALASILFGLIVTAREVTALIAPLASAQEQGQQTAPPAAPEVSEAEIDAARERARAIAEEAWGPVELEAPPADGALTAPPAAPAGVSADELNAARAAAQAAAESEEEFWDNRPADGPVGSLALAALDNPLIRIMLQVAALVGLPFALLMLPSLAGAAQFVHRRVAAVLLTLWFAGTSIWSISTQIGPSIMGALQNGGEAWIAGVLAGLALISVIVFACAIVALFGGVALAARSQFHAAIGWRPAFGKLVAAIGRGIGLPNYVQFLPRGRLTLSLLFALAAWLSVGQLTLQVAIFNFPAQAYGAYLGASNSSMGLFLAVGQLAALPVLALVFWLLSLVGGSVAGFGRARAADAYQDVRDADTRAPILFLRSFARDAQILPIRRHGILPRLVRRFANPTVFDELLLDLGAPFGPVIAIGKPNEPIPPLGAARTYVRGNDWQTVVVDLADASHLIVIMLDQTAGVRWEAEVLLGGDRGAKAVFVTNPWVDDAEAWRQVETVAKTAVEIDSKQRPLALYDDPEAGQVLLTAKDGRQQSYAAALNWCLLAHPT